MNNFNFFENSTATTSTLATTRNHHQQQQQQEGDSSLLLLLNNNDFDQRQQEQEQYKAHNTRTLSNKLMMMTTGDHHHNLGKVINILETTEDILHENNKNSNASFSPCCPPCCSSSSKNNDEQQGGQSLMPWLEPLPLGPQGSRRLVNEISLINFADSLLLGESQVDDREALFDVLVNPFLMVHQDKKNDQNVNKQVKSANTASNNSSNNNMENLNSRSVLTTDVMSTSSLFTNGPNIATTTSTATSTTSTTSSKKRAYVKDAILIVKQEQQSAEPKRQRCLQQQDELLPNEITSSSSSSSQEYITAADFDNEQQQQEEEESSNLLLLDPSIFDHQDDNDDDHNETTEANNNDLVVDFNRQVVSVSMMQANQRPQLMQSHQHGNQLMQYYQHQIVQQGQKHQEKGEDQAVVLSLAQHQHQPNDKRFRTYQFDQWKEKFQELIQFQSIFGHCLVPHNFPPNQQLAQWVKRQRYQYKLKQQGRHSTLTKERQFQLDQMGFVWDSHQAIWVERFEDLKTFKAKHGNCSVPSNYVDRTLAIWVKCQRRQYKLHQQGCKSSMTQSRIEQLESLGFDWNPRNL